LGQLLQAAAEPGWMLGVAMPDTARFARHRDRTPESVRSALGLHWLIVGSDGELFIETPEAP
jgi:hypothetical protein